MGVNYPFLVESCSLVVDVTKISLIYEGIMTLFFKVNKNNLIIIIVINN